MGKVVKPLLVVAAIGVNVIPGVGSVLSAGIISSITAAGITAGIGVAASALGLGPKAPSISPAARNRLYAQVDPRTPRKFVVGETAFASDVRYQEWTGADQEYRDDIICLASHRITSVDELWLDDKLAWTAAGGAQGEFAGYLSVDVRLEGTAGNTIAIGNGSKWGAARRMTGLAYMRLRFKVTGNGKKKESPFASGIPSRLTTIGRGAPVYDPRYDSTRGGSGPARADDESTWQYSYAANTQSGRNPALQLLSWLLGYRINERLAVGRGTPPARINLAAFITAANACDEPVALTAGGSEPRYRADGIFSEADDPRQIIDTYEATMNGKLRDAGGRFALNVISNDLATPRFDFDDSDVLDAFKWSPTAEIERAYNEIRGGYTDASRNSLFQLVDYPRLREVPSDGIERVLPFDLPLVQSPSQAQRLVKQLFARNKYQGRFEANFGARGWSVQLGDVVTLTFSALGWDRKLFRVVEHGVRPDGICPMVLQEEHPDIYLWDRDERPAVQPVDPTPYDVTKSLLLKLLVAGEIDYGDGSVADAIDQALSDGYLDPSEKRQAQQAYDRLVEMRDALNARYTALGNPADVTPAKDDAAAKLAALLAYLQTLVPGWLDFTSVTPVPDRDAYRNAWRDAERGLEVYGAAITGRPGRDGLDGDDGLPGANGQSVHIAYADNITGTLNFTTGEAGGRQFIGVYTDTNPGADSPNPADYGWTRLRGLDGERGLAGPGGYVHLAYADSADGSVNFHLSDPTGRRYLGVYTDQVEADSPNPASYAWSLIKGADGRDGLDGDDGLPGANGQTVHIAYADNITGTLNFTTGDAGGRSFIGVYTDTNPGADSPDPASYGWTRLRGLDGERGIAGPGGYVHIAYANGPNGSPDFHLSDPTNRTYIGVYTDQVEADSNDPASYAWSLIKGANGISPVSVTAQPEALQIAVDANGAPASGALPAIIGNTATQAGAPVAISSVTLGTVNGVSAEIANGTSVRVTALLGGNDGEINYTVVAGGQEIKKRIIVSVVRSGADGAVQQNQGITTPQLTSENYQPNGHGAGIAINSSAGGRIDVNLTGNMRAPLGGYLQFYSKIQYRSAGGIWSDVPNSEKLSTISEQVFEPNRQLPAQVNGTGPYAITGLAASSPYEIRALTRKASAAHDNSASVNLALSAKQV